MRYQSPIHAQAAFGQWEFTAVCFFLCPALHCSAEQLSYCKQLSVFLQTGFAATLTYLHAVRVTGATLQDKTYCPDEPNLTTSLSYFTLGSGQPSNLLNDRGLQPRLLGQQPMSLLLVLC